MSNLVKLTRIGQVDRDDLAVYVNPAHVAYITEIIRPDGTSIHLAIRDEIGHVVIRVRESAETVAALLDGAVLA